MDPREIIHDSHSGHIRTFFSSYGGFFSSQKESFFLDAKGEKEYVSWVQLGSPRFQAEPDTVQTSATDW